MAKGLSFSIRLGATSKMQVSALAKAYKTANPGCQSSDASKHARVEEERAKAHAESINEYHELISKCTALLLKSAPPSRQLGDQESTEHHYPNLPNSSASIGRYTNASHHKDGLFSEVFLANVPIDEAVAIDKDDKPTVVALKVTTPAMMQPPHNSLREARILQSVEGRQVIPLLETFEQAGGRYVLVFPYMPLELNSMLRNRQIDEQNQRAILRDLFAALSHIHGLGIIHRDVKPSNILLASPSGPAYLSDFGIAWSPSDPTSEPPEQKILDVGTTCYRPPELLFGCESYSNKLDIWAAGCVVAQVACLGYRTLFDAGDLGSELALIKSQFETLGTPNEEVWPETKHLPDWGKMAFTVYPSKPWAETLPECPEEVRDLVSRMVVFESSQRLSADEALQHAFLKES